MMKKQDPYENTYLSDRPVFLFDVAAIETWLEDQARQGYRLVRFRGMRGEFVWDSPAECRYRLSPMPRREKAPDPEQAEAFRELGWTYVASLGKTFHLWRCDDPEARELDTDPVVQGEGYRHLKRRMTRELAAELLVLAVLFGFWAVPRSATPLLDLVALTPAGFLVIRVLLLLAAILLAAAEWRIMVRLLHRLKTGIPLDRPVSYRWKTWGLRACAVFCVLFYCVSPNSILVHDTFQGRELEDPAAAVQVTLHDLDPALPETPEGVWAERRSQELAPEVSRAVQETGDASILTDYYRLRWTALASTLTEELRYRWDWEGAMEPVAAAELDGFWWKRLENGQQRVIAARGRQVLYIDYTGSADLREQSAVIAAAFPE